MHVKHLGYLALCKYSVVHYCDTNGYNNKNNEIILIPFLSKSISYCFGVKSNPFDCIMYVGIK